jgi:hypothetical protein
MAYSRWLTSRWYTFWSWTPSEEPDDQIFQICEFGGGIGFTYKEIKEDIDDCLKRVIEHLKEPKDTKIFNSEIIRFVGPLPTDSEVEELKGYMREFLIDVEKSEENV